MPNYSFSYLLFSLLGGHEPEVFRNRKQYFSKNVMVVAGPSLQIHDIVCQYPGSTHDQTIFDLSLLSIRFEREEFGDKLLLGMWSLRIQFSRYDNKYCFFFNFSL